jgi:RNA polymerase sigma-70 factor (ECF subfamily)
MDQPDDVELVRASQQGDRDAFGALISRHARSILSLTTRMLGPVDAEDVAQETFIAAHKALPSFKLDSKFSTWLYRIGVNKCTDSLRSRRPENTSLDVISDEGAMALAVADDETPHDELEQAELAWELDRGIQGLPQIYRESFVLRHIEGLGYEEMSAILGVHRDTLKMRVYKARTLLCQSLAHLDGAYR